MRIGELASQSGVSARSLRYYEQQGLITSQRSPSGQRHYDEDSRERVLLIRSLLAAGLTTRTILDVLPCITDETIRTPKLERRLRAELRRIDEQVTCLQSTRRTLESVVDRYSSTRPRLAEADA